MPVSIEDVAHVDNYLRRMQANHDGTITDYHVSPLVAQPGSLLKAPSGFAMRVRSHTPFLLNAVSPELLCSGVYCRSVCTSSKSAANGMLARFRRTDGTVPDTACDDIRERLCASDELRVLLEEARPDQADSEPSVGVYMGIDINTHQHRVETTPYVVARGTHGPSLNVFYDTVVDPADGGVSEDAAAAAAAAAPTKTWEDVFCGDEGKALWKAAARHRAAMVQSVLQALDVKESSAARSRARFVDMVTHWCIDDGQPGTLVYTADLVIPWLTSPMLLQGSDRYGLRVLERSTGRLSRLVQCPPLHMLTVPLWTSGGDLWPLPHPELGLTSKPSADTYRRVYHTMANDVASSNHHLLPICQVTASDFS